MIRIQIILSFQFAIANVFCLLGLILNNEVWVFMGWGSGIVALLTLIAWIIKMSWAQVRHLYPRNEEAE